MYRFGLISTHDLSVARYKLPFCMHCWARFDYIVVATRVKTAHVTGIRFQSVRFVSEGGRLICMRAHFGWECVCLLVCRSLTVLAMQSTLAGCPNRRGSAPNWAEYDCLSVLLLNKIRHYSQTMDNKVESKYRPSLSTPFIHLHLSSWIFYSKVLQFWYLIDERRWWSEYGGWSTSSQWSRMTLPRLRAHPGRIFAEMRFCNSQNTPIILGVNAASLSPAAHALYLAQNATCWTR